MAVRHDIYAQQQGTLADLLAEPRLHCVAPKLVDHARAALGEVDVVLFLDPSLGPRGGHREDGFARIVGDVTEDRALVVLEDWLARGLETGRTRLVSDIAAVPELEELRASWGSACCAPLPYGSEELGVIVALGESLDERELAVLEGFATHTSIALANARLFEAQEALAKRDPLTGLLNHREFHEALSHELKRCRRSGGRFGVVMLDLDDFKVVNDSAGHAAGDHVLKGAGAALMAACRASDEAFRVGGDEFALLVRDAAGDEARSVAGRAAARVRRDRRRAGLSYGVSAWPGDGPTKDALLRHADMELYAMKRERRQSRGGVSGGRQATSLQPGAAMQRERLAVTSRVATLLAHARSEEEVAHAAVAQLHHSFDYFLAVIQRLDQDGVLRVVAAEGPLTEGVAGFLAFTQSVEDGVNGRVARTGEPALVPDTRRDPDYLGGRDHRTDPRSELSMPIRVGEGVWGVLNLEQQTTNAFSDEDLLLADTVAGQVGAALHRCALVTELESAFLTTLGVLADAVELQDPYTAEHAREVSDLAVGVGTRLGFEGAELDRLRYGALLHDVGKIGVPGEILRKPAVLTPAERQVIERHTITGAQMLERIPFLAPVAPLVRSAHERVNGGGYPDGLVGDQIPRGALVIAACDALHAMTSDRTYRPAMTQDAALAELQRNAGTQFDAATVEAVMDEALAPSSACERADDSTSQR